MICEQTATSTEQKFLFRVPNECTAIAVSPDRRVVSFAIKSSDPDRSATLVVLQRDNLKQRMRTSFLAPGRVLAIQFSSDSKSFVAIGGKSKHYAIGIYRWDMQRTIATTTLKDRIRRVQFVHGGGGGIIVAGENLLRSFHVSGMVLQEKLLLPAMKESSMDYTDIVRKYAGPTSDIC